MKDDNLKKLMSVFDLESMLTTKEVAELFQVSPRHIQNQVKSGVLPKPIALGRSVRFRPSDIRRILNGDVDDGGLMNQSV